MRAHQIKSNVFLRLPFLNHKKILTTINNRSHCQGTESRSIPTPILASIEVIEIENDAIMASAATQAQANALNAKMEGEASKMLDDVERNWMRKVARQSFACAVQCYDKAGTTGAAESLEACTRNCQGPYQQSSSMVQQVRIIYTYIYIYIFMPTDFLFVVGRVPYVTDTNE